MMQRDAIESGLKSLLLRFGANMRGQIKQLVNSTCALFAAVKVMLSFVAHAHMINLYSQHRLPLPAMCAIPLFTLEDTKATL